MKTLDSKLFKDSQIVEKMEMECISGGNNSDVTYTDSQNGGSYDIAIQSLIDIVDSSRAMDKPEQLVEIPEYL